MIAIWHCTLENNPCTPFTNNIVFFQAIQNIISSKVQALESSQFPCTSLTGLFQRPSLNYSRDRKRNGANKQANNKQELQGRRERALDSRLMSSIYIPIFAGAQIGTAKTRITHKRSVIEITKLTSTRDQTSKIVVRKINRR
ncbi:hypothetical protein OIU76_024281 [Salix suchowensis]|nr:hypothetical protein OIU76_024281 [Salix suchowensis]